MALCVGGRKEGRVLLDVIDMGGWENGGWMCLLEYAYLSSRRCNRYRVQ